MSMNIKNEEAHRLARELADHTGESMTEAVTEALRERLERIESTQKEEALVEELLEIARDCARHLPASVRDVDHGELLYDDRGLPK